MAKIEQAASNPSASAIGHQQNSAAKNKKRKLKELQAAGSDNDNDRSTEADSPTSKFKKLGKKRRRLSVIVGSQLIFYCVTVVICTCSCVRACVLDVYMRA